MTARRSDAARSRERILEVARGRDAGELRLNEVARDAGVGVATVYRHFPTVHALVEALSMERLELLRDLARRVAAQQPAIDGLDTFVREGLTLQLEDGGLQQVLLASHDDSDRARDLKREIQASFTDLFERAASDGALRPGLTTEHVQHLVCGVEHAVRIGRPEDREPLLAVVLAGIRAPR